MVFRSIFDVAAPHPSIPATGAVDVAPQAAIQQASVHAGAAVERGLLRARRCVKHAVVVRLSVDAGHSRRGIEDLPQVDVEIVSALVADLVEGQPLGLVRVAEVDEA